MKLSNAKALKKVNIFQIRVTPEIAEMLLAINYKNNRKIVPQKLAQYKEDMLSGRWDSSIVEPIHIEVDERGEWICMYSGQHRALAVLESGVAIPMWIDLSANESQYTNMDNGASRKTVDFLDVENAKNVSALAKTVYRTINGNKNAATILHGKFAPSRQAEIDLIQAKETEFHKAVSMGTRLRKKLGCGSLAACSFFAWVVPYLRLDDCLDDYVEDFTQQFSKEIAVRAAQSALLFKQGEKIVPERILGTLMYSYLKYRNGEEPKRISWKAGNEEVSKLLERRQTK